MRKINKRRFFTVVLDRFQNDEVFRASQLQRNWTREWCEDLDYIKTIDITHNASAALYHFSVPSKIYGDTPFQKVVQTITKHAGHCQHEQRSRSESTDFFQEETHVSMIWTQRRSNGLYGSQTIGNLISRLTDTQIQTLHRGINKNQKKSKPRKTEKHRLVHMIIGGKQIGGTSPDTLRVARTFSSNIFFA